MSAAETPSAFDTDAAYAPTPPSVTPHKTAAPGRGFVQRWSRRRRRDDDFSSRLCLSPLLDPQV